MTALPAKPAYSAWQQILLVAAGGLFLMTASAQQSASTGVGGVLEEIVVVAQKRPQSMQDVPVAVGVFSAEKIERTGMLRITELSDLQPSVVFDTGQSFQNSSLKIRGIGTFGNGRTFEGSAGVFVDGVYRPRSGMILTDMLDIEHLEVMRGSQGTLYGKNTVAGAIALVSNAPKLSELSGELTLRYGDYDDEFVAGTINVPIGEEMALRLSGNLHHRQAFFRSPDDGYGYDTLDRYQVKAQYLFALHDDLSVRVIADFGRSDSQCCWGTAQVEPGPLSPIVAAYAGLNGLSFVTGPRAESERLASLNTHPLEKVDDDGIAAYVDWNVGNATVRSITSIRRWTHEQIEADADFAPIDVFRLNEPAQIDSFSEEITYGNAYGNTDLLLGVYIAQEDYESVQRVDTGADADNFLNALISTAQGAAACLPPFAAVDCLFPTSIGALLADGGFSRTAFSQDTDTVALFGHAVTQLADRFDLVTGLRWNVEEKSGGAQNLYWYDSAIARAVLEAAGIPDDGTPRNGFDILGTFYSPSFEDKTRDDEISGALTGQFSPTETMMLYITYRRGYKAGGVNLFREAALTNTQTYEPETSDDFEVGLKTSFLSGRARANFALFDTQFSNLQVNFFDGLNFRTENVGEASTRGFEIEAEFQVTDRLLIDASGTWLRARFDRIDNPFLSYLNGRDTPRAPEWASVVGLSWDRPLRSGLRFFVNGTVSYMGSHFVGADVIDEHKVDSYWMSRAGVGLRSERGNWEAQLWCTNCGDETYRTIYFNAPAQPGSYNAYLNDSRQYGATVRLKF